MQLLARLGRGFEQAVVPHSCAFCGGRLPADRPPVCKGCFDDLPWIPPVFELRPFTTAAAPLEYAFPVDAAIKMFKFRRRLFYAPALAHLLRNTVNMLPGDIDALLPVPLHWRRQTLRGFNQTLEIARPIVKQTGLRLIRSASRGRATPFQSGLAAAHRRRNLRNAFSIRGEIAARHVLILDDVITTGATCRELGKLVLRSGAEKVSVLGVARVV